MDGAVIAAGQVRALPLRGRGTPYKGIANVNLDAPYDLPLRSEPHSDSLPCWWCRRSMDGAVIAAGQVRALPLRGRGTPYKGIANVNLDAPYDLPLSSEPHSDSLPCWWCRR